jgi:drug/metabolite transporter (DMT)-like permease
MLGIALALGSSVAWGISDFLGGLQTRRASALGVLLVTQPVGLFLALGVALGFGGDSLSSGQAVAAVAAGAVGVLALGAFYRAMALGSVSVVSTIGALGIVVPITAGIAGGEVLTGLEIAGGAAAIAGAVLVAREPKHLRTPSASLHAAFGAEAPHQTDTEWRSANTTVLGLAALAALGFGAFFWLLDLGSPANPAWTIVLARTGGVAVLLVAAVAVRPSLPLDRERLPILAVIGFCDILANSLFTISTNHGLLSLVSVAGSMYAAVTVLLARVVLGERLARSQRAGIVLALGGIALLAAGS